MRRYGRGKPHGGADFLLARPVARNADALTAWGTALSGLNFAAAKWLAIGDGITEGQGASTRANRWIDQTLATIRASKSATGGQGFVSAAYGVTGSDSPWASTQVTYGGAATTGTTAGVGYRHVQLAMGGAADPYPGSFAPGETSPASSAGGGGGTPGSVAFTVTGTSADLWYVSESTSGTFTYKVDAGSTVTVSTAGAHDLRTVNGINLGAVGSHTVTVTVTAGTVYIAGLMVYSGDAASGIQLYDAARNGITSSGYATDLPMVTDLASTVAPHLVSIELGSTDAAATVPPVTTVANIAALIAMLRALPRVPAIVLVIPHHPVPTGSGTSTTTTTGFGTSPFGTSAFGVGVTTTTSGTSSTGALPRTGWTIVADSQETAGENGAATNAIDGDPATYWHTHWSGGVEDPLPHTLTIDMKAATTVSAVKYLPRSGGGNGTIGQYSVSVSIDGATWGSPVATGTWADDGSEKTASFTDVSARYVRLTAITEAGGRGAWSSAAEVNVVGTTAAPTAGWPDYVTALRNMAVVDPSITLLDLSLALPAADASGTGLYRTDGKNLNDSGHSAVAAQFASLVNLNVIVAPGATGTASGRHLLLAGVV